MDFPEHFMDFVNELKRQVAEKEEEIRAQRKSFEEREAKLAKEIEELHQRQEEEATKRMAMEENSRSKVLSLLEAKVQVETENLELRKSEDKLLKKMSEYEQQVRQLKKEVDELKAKLEEMGKMNDTLTDEMQRMKAAPKKKRKSFFLDSDDDNSVDLDSGFLELETDSEPIEVVKTPTIASTSVAGLVMNNMESTPINTIVLRLQDMPPGASLQEVEESRKRKMPSPENQHGEDTKMSVGGSFVCICKARFQDLDALNNHLKYYVEGNLGCTLCGNRFNFFGIFKRHLQMNHGKVLEMDDEQRFCSLCGKMNLTREEYVEHFKKNHYSEDVELEMFGHELPAEVFLVRYDRGHEILSLKKEKEEQPNTQVVLLERQQMNDVEYILPILPEEEENPKEANENQPIEDSSIICDLIKYDYRKDIMHKREPQGIWNIRN